MKRMTIPITLCGSVNLKGNCMFKQLIAGLVLMLGMPLAAYAQNLTGVFHDPNGVPYYIRQVGREIWWFGENDPDTPNFSSVAHGKIHQDRIILSWADVPKGANQGSGILVFQVNPAHNRLDLILETGGWCCSPLIK